MIKNATLIILLIIVCSACQNHKREEQLTNWEQALKKREQQLTLKEADYQSLLCMRDSLFASKDTAVVRSWPAAIDGAWKSTVICKESNCNNYVIGDQRTETWEFAADSTGLFVRVLNDKKLVRIYNARFEQQHIQLHFQTDSTAQKKVDMQVALDDIQSDVIKGTQLVTGEKNCTAKFAVELIRPTKK